MSTENLYFSRDTKLIAEMDGTFWELPVLDGFSFSQATNATEVTLSEMDSATTGSRRGRRLFTDSYAPAEWSFATYARPYLAAGGNAIGTLNSTTKEYSAGTQNVQRAVEEVLWASLAGSGIVFDNTTSLFENSSNVNKTVVRDGVNKMTVNFSESNKSALKTFNLFFLLGSGANDGARATGTITSADNTAATAAGASITVAVTSAGAAGDGTIATGDICSFTNAAGIVENSVVATVNAGQTSITLGDQVGAFADGTVVTFSRMICYKIKESVCNEASIDFEIDGITTINWSGFGKIIEEVTPPFLTNMAFNSGTGKYVSEGTLSTTNFIRNRLTTLTCQATLPTTDSYNFTLTGGNISISNNITFLTPETLGSVNQPLAHVTGGRTVGGNFTCYLNTADEASADLFQDLVDASTTVTNSFALDFSIGGASAPKVVVKIPTAHLELPAHQIEDVITIDTTFHGLPSNISNTDEVTLEYVGS
jgi:hypothetical protein